MYYKDLSHFDYIQDLVITEPAMNVGWLSSEYEYVKSEANSDFIDALWAFCNQPIIEHRGFHACELCAHGNNLVCLNHKGHTISLGYKLICVFGSDGAAYLSPDLIFHYVVEHHYAPPQSFVNAVLLGPQPGSLEYAMKVRSYTDGPHVESVAREAARNEAARFGYFLDSENRAIKIPNEMFTKYPELSVEELALELRLQTYR